MDSTPRLVAVSGDLSLKSIKQLQDAIARYDQLILDEIRWRYEVLGSVELSPAWLRYCDERHVYRTELWMRCPHLGPQAQKIESESAPSATCVDESLYA